MIRRQFYTILSVPVFLYLYAYSAAIVLLILILANLKRKRGICLVLSIWAKTVFPMMGKKLHIEGRNHFVKGHKYILLANHASLFDIIAIMAFYPDVSWFGHERLLRIPLVKQMLQMTNYIPMRVSNLTNTRKRLSSLEEQAQNKTVAIFPEGTRTLDGKLNPVYRGFIHLLRATGHDILPVTLNGFYKIKPKNRFFINFGSKLAEEIMNPTSGGGFGKEILPELQKRVSAKAILAGTGNDFIQILGFTNDFSDEHWELLFQPVSIKMDVGCVNGELFLIPGETTFSNMTIDE